MVIWGVGMRDLRDYDSETRFLLVSITAFVVFIATYLYILVAKKVEPGSPAWWYGLIISALLLAFGFLALKAGYSGVGGILFVFATTVVAIHMGGQRLNGNKRP